MTQPESPDAVRIPLSRSQQNIYNGVLQDSGPTLYLIGRSYRFHRLELSEFLTALTATITTNPIQLCVLDPSQTGDGYPDLVRRLQAADIVRVLAYEDRVAHEGKEAHAGAVELTRTWLPDITAKPLVRYTVYTDEAGLVCGLDVHSHHILLDGGGTGIVENDLGRFLEGKTGVEIPGIAEALNGLAKAHLREASKVDESFERLGKVVQHELASEAHRGGYGQAAEDVPGAAARGVLQESVTISGTSYDAIHTLSERRQVPLNILVAAAAVAVDASLRQSTESLLVHPVDNRFGDPDLNVATCLVNSVAQSFRFPAFASVQDVVRALDRGYVKAVRRRWLREEQYRRMYLATNRTSHVEALTLNFLPEPCAPALRPFLSAVPVTTDIGPVESMTVTSVLDEEQRTLSLLIWNRADLSERAPQPRIAERIAATLGSMTAYWDNPIAMVVDEWFGITDDGALRPDDQPAGLPEPRVPAWFVNPAGGVSPCRDGRRYIDPWIAWLVQNGAEPGDVLVFTDDNTDRTTDLLIACHLAGCAYSVCDNADQVAQRASIIAGHSDGISTHVIDTGATALAEDLDLDVQGLIDSRLERVSGDSGLADKTAYIMPTSGSTGLPKLVCVTHKSLAVFCHAVKRAYGWGSHDIILQCAPLTSDISVEEVFGGALSGARLIRSPAVKSGDLQALARDLVTYAPTVIDLPTAVWHLLCDDAEAIDAIRGSRLRQIVIGGEAIRSSAVDTWIEAVTAQHIALISSYGPTETTVIVTYLPITRDGSILEGGARLRLGRPLVPGSVFIAFGEVVVLGDMVSSGYLGLDSESYGTATTVDGVQRRAFATADRVSLDHHGFPVFAGRKDAVLKVAGRRVDTAEITKRITEDTAVLDMAIELHNGALAVWFETRLTRAGRDDAPAAGRIRAILTASRVPSFRVVGVPSVPRKPNGKIDSADLRIIPEFIDSVRDDTEAGERAAGLAQIWSLLLDRGIRPDSSLLDEGIGSLDLIRVLPDTRRYLGRQISILDLISADTANNLVVDVPTDGTWMDRDTAAAIARDFAALREQRPSAGRSVRPSSKSRDGRPILVLGASGILGTGFAQALLDLKRSGVRCPDVVLATRSALPAQDPWATLRRKDGVRIERLPAGFGPEALDDLIRDTDAGTLINCIGNTNVVVPYGQLRRANVEFVAAMVEACTSIAARLVHLSTFVVNADVTAPQATDPRDAPYPYAASKALAELAVAGSPAELDFTVARLPRVLGEPDQMQKSADILVSIVDACIELQTYPSVTLTEEVTTGRSVASGILSLLPEFAGPAQLGRGITVVRGAAVQYAQFLAEFATEELEATEWKYRLDGSDWAKRNPQRWSVIDAWMSLGARLGTRSYAEYLSEYPSIDLEVGPVVELETAPQSLHDLLLHGCSRTTSDGIAVTLQ